MSSFDRSNTTKGSSAGRGIDDASSSSSSPIERGQIRGTPERSSSDMLPFIYDTQTPYSAPAAGRLQARPDTLLSPIRTSFEDTQSRHSTSTGRVQAQASSQSPTSGISFGSTQPSFSTPAAQAQPPYSTPAAPVQTPYSTPAAPVQPPYSTPIAAGKPRETSQSLSIDYDESPPPSSPKKAQDPAGTERPFSPRPGPSAYAELTRIGRSDLDDSKLKTMRSVMDENRDAYTIITKCNDMSRMRAWIEQNFEKVVYFNYLHDKLKEMASVFALPLQIQWLEKYEWNADAVIKVLRQLLETCQRKLAMMDVSYELPETARGLSFVIEKTRKKMTDLICDLQDIIREQQTEIAFLKEELLQVDELQAELEAARNHIKYLNERDRYDVRDPLNQDEFMQDLQYRLTMQERLSSTLREDLEHERRTNFQIMEEYLRTEAKRTRDHQEQMREIAEATRQINLLEDIRKEIIPKIQSLSPNPAEIHKAVDEWIKTTQGVLEERKREMGALGKTYKELEKQYGDMQFDIDRIQTEINERKNVLENAKRMFDSISRQIEGTHKATKRVQKIKKELEEMEAQEQLQQTPDLRSARERTFAGRMRDMGRGMKKKISKLKFPSAATPTQGQLRLRERLSPRMGEYSTPEVLRLSSPSLEYPEQFEDGMLITDTSSRASPRPVSPSSDIPFIEVTPPSPTGSGAVISEAVGPSITTPRPGTPFISRSRFGFTDPTVPPRELNLPPGACFEIATSFRQSFVLTSPKREEPLLVNIGVDPKPLTETESGECFVCDISLDVQPGGHDMLPHLPEISGGYERTLERSDSPVIRGRRFGRRNIPPEITPTTTRRHGLFTPKGIFKKGQVNVRRIPGRHAVSELPWSPTYLPEDARSPITSLSSPIYWSDRSVSWERSGDSYYGSSPSPSPVIKGTYRYRSPYSPEEFSPSPVIKGPTYRYQSSDSEGISPYEPDMSLDRSLERTFESRDSPIIRGRRVGRRGVPPDVTPTSTRRHGLFTPRGIFRKGQVNIRRIPGSYQASELPWSPTFLPEDARSPVISLSSPLYWSDRSVSWEKSGDSYGPSPYSSPVIKRPIYSYRTPDSEQFSPSPVIKRPTYKDQSPDSYRSSPSPVIVEQRSPSPIIKGPIYQSPDSYLSSPSPIIQRPAYATAFPGSSSPAIQRSPHGYQSPAAFSPVIKGPAYEFAFPDAAHSSPSPVIQGPSYSYQTSPAVDSRSPSPVIKGRAYGYPSPGTDYSTPSPIISGRSHRAASPVPSPLFPSPPSGYISEFERSGTPQSMRMHDSSPLNQTFESTPSPHQRSYQDPLNRRMQLDEMLGSHGTPQSMGTYDSSPMNQTFESTPSSFQRSYQDPLNRRMQFDEMYSSHGTPQSMGTYDSSPMNQAFGSTPSPLQRSYHDPLNRRMHLDEMFESSRTSDRSFSPQIPGTPGRHSSPDRTYDSDSIESDGGYREGSPDSSLLHETRYFN